MKSPSHRWQRGVALSASLHLKYGTPYLFTSANLKHTLPSDVILRRTTFFQPILPPSGPCNAPWFSSETLALYKSLTYLLIYVCWYDFQTAATNTRDMTTSFKFDGVWISTVLGLLDIHWLGLSFPVECEYFKKSTVLSRQSLAVILNASLTNCK